MSGRSARTGERRRQKQHQTERALDDETDAQDGCRQEAGEMQKLRRPQRLAFLNQRRREQEEQREQKLEREEGEIWAAAFRQ
jgi:hypothetical protein